MAVRSVRAMSLEAVVSCAAFVGLRASVFVGGLISSDRESTSLRGAPFLAVRLSYSKSLTSSPKLNPSSFKAGLSP
jgi:hypothetical protein